MAIALDQKDLTQIDQKLEVGSQIFQPLTGGSSLITADDFVGVREVRINKMSGFVDDQDYQRNGENGTASINVEKETFRLGHEDWFSYSLDNLDASENQAVTVLNITNQHLASKSIPKRDRVAAQAIYDAAKKNGNLVKETIDEKNVLASYDAAEAHMIDNEVTGGFIMFASSAYLKSLKNAVGVSRTFTTNQQGIQGIDRTVSTIDGSVPILPVSKQRLQGTGIAENVNFMLVPVNAVAPVLKLNTVDFLDAESDRSGYRSLVKGINYFDVFTFDNASTGIYVSVDASSASSTSSTGK